MDDEKLNKFFASRAKQLRLERKITHEKFRDETGLNSYRIEIGTRNFNSATLKKICRYYQISLNDFFENFKEYMST